MHKVERNEAPKELINKNMLFQENYKEIDVSSEWDKFSSTKTKKLTLEKLKEMYNESCAYCEGKYGSTSYAQIDHFKPKSMYPELVFDYNNMNLSCEICNNRKKEKYDEKLIDPSKENPEEHIKFDGPLATALDISGKITIDIFDLNREELKEDRVPVISALSNRMNLVKKYVDVLRKGEYGIGFLEFMRDILIDTIKYMEEVMSYDGEYCTTYRHNFEEDLAYCKAELENINKNY